MTLKHFESVAKQFNNDLTILVSNKGAGGEEHWRIVGGPTTVSWWPYSSKQTALCEGTKHTVRWPDVQKVLALTNRKPKQKRKQHDLACPDCGKIMKLRRDSKFKKHGLWYACQDWPKCKGAHGAHPDGRPLGIPADAETKGCRIRAHAAFDGLWKGTGERAEAYRWLATSLDLSIEKCHIGSFDAATCEKVIDLIRMKNLPVETEKRTFWQLIIGLFRKSQKIKEKGLHKPNKVV